MPRILCLTSHDLDGPDYGALLRARNLFQLLARVGEVRLVLAGFYESWSKAPGSTCGGFELLRTIRFERTPKISITDRLRHELDPRFMNTDWIQARTEDRVWLENTIAQHDLVWVHGLALANGFGLWRWPHSVLDIDDIPSSYHRSQLPQTAGFAKKIALRRQIFLWQRHERTLAERFDAVCVCSEPDRATLGHLDRTFVVPNGFTLPQKPTARQPANPPHLGFIGNFSYAPNRQGAHWFIEQVWPSILKKNPAARLRLVGAKSDLEKWPAHLNIDALGWLPDVAAEMAGWTLSVVPVLAGGGTRVKIAEAFSRRCPVVSTSLGAYGYGVTDGQEIFLADQPAVFADKCLRLLSEPGTGKKLAEAAWEKFIASWTWEAQAGKVAAVANHALTRPASR